MSRLPYGAVFVAALSLSTFACERSESAATQTASAGTSTAAATPSAKLPAATAQAPRAAPPSQRLPVEEDFALEAAQQIHADNLEAELDKIEKELLSGK